MATIHITNLPKPVAVALDWHLLPGTTSERREIDAIAKQTGAKIGCIVSDPNTGGTLLGVADERSPGANCGAAWLAKASARESLVLVEPLDGGRLWICAVRAGLPVQNLDVIVDMGQLHVKLPEFLRDSPDARICSTIDGLENDYANVSPQSFAELVANTKPERLVRVSGVSPVFVAGTTVAVVAFGLYFGGDAYLKKLRQEESQAKLAALAVQQKERDAQSIQRAQLAHEAAGTKLLKEVVLDQPAIDLAMDAIFRTVETLPLGVNGWSLAGFECTNQSCAIRWERSKVGTIVGFLEAADSRQWVVSNAKGNVAMTVIDLQLPSRGAGVDALSQTDAFRAALESRLQLAQLAGMSYDLPEMASIEKSLPAPVIQKGAPPPPPTKPLPWMVGTAAMKGEQLFAAKTVPSIVSNPAVALKFVKADLKTKQWNLEVNYATR